MLKKKKKKQKNYINLAGGLYFEVFHSYRINIAISDWERESEYL